MSRERPFLWATGSRPADAPDQPRVTGDDRWGECLRTGFDKPDFVPDYPTIPLESCPDPDLKRCTKCFHWKRRDEFHRESARKDGLSFYCRSCARIKNARSRAKYRPCTPFAGRAETGKYVLCSIPRMARRPHDEVTGFKRGYEPCSHPIWVRRVRRMLTSLEDGPLTAAEIQTILRVTKKWNPAYTVNVLIAAQEFEMVAYDGSRWHAHVPGAAMPPKVEKSRMASPDPTDDIYPDQLPL